MQITSKIIIGLIFFIVLLLGLGAWDIRQNNIKTIVSGQAHAGIFDDISTAIKGHIDDVIDRQKDDEFITGEVKAKGEFTLSKDSIHWAEGSVQVIEKEGKMFIQLGEDFEAGLAPDLYIFTSKDVIDSQSALDKTYKANLQKLVKGSGASFYDIHHRSKVKSIVIWCQAFNQWMGTAIIK